MAEINQFGKGIALNCGFDLGAQQLLDSRSIVADRTELEAIPNIRRANGLLVWIQDEKKLVAWDEPNSAWVEVSGDTSNIEQIASDLEALELRVNANGDTIYDLKTQISEIEVDDTFYSDKSYALTSAHGGLASGTDVSGWKIKDILKKILFPLRVPKVVIDGYPNGMIVKLGYGDYYSINLKQVTVGDFAMSTECRIVLNNNEIFSGLYKDYIDAGQEDDLSVEFTNKMQLFLKTDIDESCTDAEILAYKDKEIASNVLTSYAVRPLFFGWSTIQAPGFPSTTKALFDAEPGTADYLWSSRPKELLTKDKTTTLSFAAQTSEARMIILSPYKISKILNPSSFDITSSFTETIGMLPADDTISNYNWNDTIKGAYEMDTYLYVSNQTSQEKAYPLTVTFE